jgi:hypothetical protein
MGLRNKSVATIDAPEFINLDKDAINPGISKCEIKVCYVGQNRNGSYFDKNTLIQMSNTLPGTPIVGHWREDDEDFGDHGQVLHIENGKMKLSCNTMPYGFVAPDAEVWFQKFTDTDEFGNELDRDYLMTTGYLWTGQYPELEKCIQEGQGQSMEIGGENMDGHWATDSRTGIDFFIVTDAEFTKLCILGDDVEPCFEGASVTQPQVSKEFAADNFNRTLFSMMNELKNALQIEGGLTMPENEIQNAEEEFAAESVEEAAEIEVAKTIEEAATEAEEVAEEPVAADEGNEVVASEEFEKKDEEDEDDSDSEDDEEKADEEEADDKEDEEEDEKFALAELQAKFDALQEKFSELESEVEGLRAFKLERDNADKDALIAKYHMLSDEDKAEVVANKQEYTLAEIESKLALIYVQKNVDFETVDGQAEEPEAAQALTFSLEDTNESADEADAFLQALRNTNLF